MTRVLVIGAGGMLGHDLLAEAPAGLEILAPPQAALDLTDAAGVAAAVSAARPAIVINAAGYTDVDGAEREPERAFAVNARGAGHLGRAAAAAGALVVQYSSDYVFDGTARRPLREDDPLAPLGAYGASKLEGERELAASGARHLVIRTQWLFGRHGRSFPRTMWERARRGDATRVVSDQIGRPTGTVDLARATWRALDRLGNGEAPSLVHFANTGVASWYDVARHVFAAAGVPGLLSPCTTADFPRPARRPAWSALDTTRYESLVGSPPPTWQDALDRFLEALRQDG